MRVRLDSRKAASNGVRIALRWATIAYVLGLALSLLVLRPVAANGSVRLLTLSTALAAPPPTDPAFERGEGETSERAIMPSAVHVERGSGTRSGPAIPWTPQAADRATPVRSFLPALSARPRVGRAPLSPARARAVLMVFLN